MTRREFCTACGSDENLPDLESVQYTSGATLPTPVGTMHGSYRMVALDGAAFEAPIRSFTLSVPRVLH